MDSPDTPEQSRLAQRLLELKTEHRDLDVAISRLQLDPGADELLVKRLKKQKLQLRDCIERLESALIPDEPA
ncbi:YdcH family protein [Luteimonas sp. MJ204]|uniref:YdcH family protein n=1 Tax=Luteimonas TaxID=83614 RepID=UPI0031BA9084